MSDDILLNPEEARITLAEMYRHKAAHDIANLLDNATASIEFSHEDDCGGESVDCYSFRLAVSPEVYAAHELGKEKIEKSISRSIEALPRLGDGKYLRYVNICLKLHRLSPADVPSVDVARIWGDNDSFRLFISHKAEYKASIAELKNNLAVFGISAFVAHEDIEVSSEWREQIEIALNSMQALVAILTEDFHTNSYTDQEVGWAMGRGVDVIAIRIGTNPQGILSKLQGTKFFNLKSQRGIVPEILSFLVKKHPDEMRNPLIVALEDSYSWANSHSIFGYLEQIFNPSPEELDRLESALKRNSQIRDAFGLPPKIQSYIAAHRPPTQVKRRSLAAR